MEYLIGTKISSMPGWEIVRELGEGSYGKVFEVHKNNFDVTAKAALKVIRIPKSISDVREAMSEGMDEQSVTTYFEGIVKRFVKEIAVMSELKSHPNIVACEDYVVEPHAGNIGWDILIRMELLTPLVNYQLKHPMNEEMVKRLAMDMCEALVFCQKKGLIHRDIKPANIFVDENGRFKLGDFGVARSAEKTMGGYSKQGTEIYMAPEVYLGRPYGATVDIYSLGLVLYRLMNGNRLPFYPAAPAPIEFSDRENALTDRLRGEPMAPPCNASEEFAAIILRACAHDSKDRYRTAAEMLEALKNLEKKEGTKGHFVREYVKDDEGRLYDREIWAAEEEDSVGSIGIDFIKTDPVQDEESIGSIGISWGKKISEEEKTEDIKEDKDTESIEENETDKEPVNLKKKSGNNAGASKKMIVLLVIVGGVLAGVGAMAMKAKNAENAIPPLSEDTIRVGVLQHYDNRTLRQQGVLGGILTANEKCPTAEIDGKEYKIELVFCDDLIAEKDASSFDKQKGLEEFDEKVAEKFFAYDCSVILDARNNSSALPEELERHGLPSIAVNQSGDWYYPSNPELGIHNFSMKTDNLSRMQAKVDFMLSLSEKPVEEQTILCIYGTSSVSGEDKDLMEANKDAFVSCVEMRGGHVKTMSYNDWAKGEFGKQDRWVAENTVDFAYITYQKDTMTIESAINRYNLDDIPVLTECDSVSLQAHNVFHPVSFDNLYYAVPYIQEEKRVELEEQLEPLRSEVNAYVDEVEGAVDGEALYDLLVDALEMGGDLSSALMTGTFENEYYGKFSFAASGYAEYEMLSFNVDGETVVYNSEEGIDHKDEEALTLIVGLEYNYAPYSYVNENGELDGYFVALANSLDDMIPEVEFEYMIMQFDSLLPSLDAGMIDLVFADCEKDENREQKYHFVSADVEMDNALNIILSKSKEQEEIQSMLEVAIQTLWANGMDEELKEYLEDM